MSVKNPWVILYIEKAAIHPHRSAPRYALKKASARERQAKTTYRNPAMKSYRTEKSRRLYERALRSIPGGASSASRTPLEGYGPYPVFVDRAEGSKLYDVDGNEYIDYLLALGPTLVGNANPRVLNFVSQQVLKGSTYGLPFELQIAVAEKLIRHVPCYEKASFMNSGTEVVQEVFRLARAFTGRDVIVKFEGNYHGWMDSVAISVHPPLDRAGPERRPNRVPIGSGIPRSAYRDIMVAPWNHPEIVERILKKNHERIAAIILDPCMCNSGVIPPAEGFLRFLREWTERYGIVLIFDEVITGFRLGLNSAQGKFGVTPDLTTLAKAIGGGFPVAAYGGRAEIMDRIADGTVFRAGTLNANRVVMAAAHATLEILEENGGSVYDEVYARGDRLMQGLRGIFQREGVQALVTGYGTMFQIHFTPLKEMRNYRDTVHSSEKIYLDFRNRMLHRGIFLRPMHMGTIYLSLSHTDEDIDRTLRAADEAIGEMKAQKVL
jgi:glutamate-1-semialdehyde 2,1-aminomutase